jgi:hypothetical protein
MTENRIHLPTMQLIPDDAIVRTVFVTPDDDQPEMMSIDDDEAEEQVDEPEEKPEEPEEQDEPEEEQQEEPLKLPVKEKEEEQEPVNKKIRSFCTERCANGGCKYCLCKRTLKQKCTDQCGCGPNCTNR